MTNLNPIFKPPTAGEPGCTDSFTGLPAVSRMEAAPGSTVVNPLTTVVAVLMAAGASQSLAEARLAQSLGLPAGIPLGTFDPISATATGTTGGSQVRILGFDFRV